MKTITNEQWNIVDELMYRNRMSARVELSRETGINDQTLKTRSKDPGSWKLCELWVVFDNLNATDEDIIRFFRARR